MRGERRFLTVVECHDLAVRQPDDGETAPANVTRGGIGDRQGKRGRHCRVDGVSAIAQHLDPDLRRERGA